MQHSLRSLRAGLAAFVVLGALLAPSSALAQTAAGDIHGTVYAASGAPAAGVKVYACAGTCTAATAGPDGAYDITGLADGSYRVAIDDVDGNVPSGYATAAGVTSNVALASSVAVVAGTPVQVDVHAPAGQRITGTITAIGGTVLQDVVVVACVVTKGFAVDTDFTPCGSALTSQDGSYSALVVPGIYRVSVYDFSYAFAWGYYSAAGYVLAPGQASPVAVGASDVAGINLALPAGQSIAGRVTGVNGAPVKGIDVEACQTSLLTACNWTTTLDDGSYTVEALPAGTYYVMFTDSTAANPTGFYGASGFTGDSGTAKPVTLSTSGVTGIDAQLPVGRVVSGVVTDAVGRPIRVEVDDCTSTICVPVVASGADGTYRMNVAEGNHKIHVGDFSGANLSGYYSVAGLANGSHATQLAVGSADLGGINVRLRRITAGVHPGTIHSGTYGASTVVVGGTYVTVRFAFGKTFAGSRVQVQRSIKSSTGVWSTYRAVATVVVASDGYAYYSTRVTGYVGFRASFTDALTAGTQVVSARVIARGR